MNKQSFAAGFAVLFFLGTQIHAVAQNGFHLKNRSSFSSGGTEHDPFWPIGWVKPAAATSSAAPRAVKEVEFTTDGFVLTSILLGQPPLAVINGKEYAEGENIPYEVSGQKINIQLVAVQDGLVVLRYHDKNYTLQLHRKGEEARQLAKFEEKLLH